ncbi:neuropilin and tolloid-like protein 2 [Hyalella azteca]|uniref:Neuropilin and tolloid-like protein 2 n=1 Tax=Hyalella azteca TaxID=294128 RepID=A0A8B7NKR5_HYAAZ|nr:neuropilin and tolloid-like protein 2 [Hyalella azteca]
MLLVSSICPAVNGQYDDSYLDRPLTLEERCRSFSEANKDSQEFYSPMYPSKYPNNTDCTLNIEAEFGYIIRVDFRDHFEIEPSENCENDFLEIRDGQHGYSDLVGRYCGSDFPPIITSQDRHLWLRFRSDESLEYKGFRAVYEFIMQEMGRPEIPPCSFETGGVAGVISNAEIPQFRFNYSYTYRMPIDCTWTIRVQEGHMIYLFFEEFELHQPNECDVNFVDLFGEARDLRSRLKHFCGSVADSVVTTTNVMHVRFFAVGQARHSKFKAWFTSFRERIVEGESDDQNVCRPDEYDCDDATCIDASLECNDIKNCRHEYDEEGCSDLKKLKFDITSQHIIIILTMGCGLLGGMCFAMCFNCVRKLISDGRQIQENIRRSREQLEGRSRSMTSIPSTPTTVVTQQRPPTMQDNDYMATVKPNGRACLPGSSEDSEEDEDLDDEMDELEDETSVEMRDCECQTRDSLSTQRDSLGQRTPPPPPPPTRRPPGVSLAISPDPVPTPPPPPASHYGRTGVPQDPYAVESDDPYRYRSHTVINVSDKVSGKTSRAATKSPKSTPDVLVTH